jgi:hypothetical protein
MPDQPKHRLTPLVDLDYYCDPDGGTRYDFTQTFVRNGWRYATDNVLCVRVPAIGEPDTEGEVPPCHTFHWPLPPHDALKPWPEAEYVFAKAWVSTDDFDDSSDVLTFEPTPEYQRVGDFEVACVNHYRVSILPNVLFLDHTEPANGIFFRFDGGEGFVMPCRPGTIAEMERDALPAQPSPLRDDERAEVLKSASSA